VYYVATRINAKPTYDALSDIAKIAFQNNFIADVATVLAVPTRWITIPTNGVTMIGIVTQIVFIINPDPTIDAAPNGRDVSTVLASQLASEYVTAISTQGSTLYSSTRLVTKDTVSSYTYTSATGAPGPDSAGPAQKGDWDFDTDFNNINLLKIVIASVVGLLLIVAVVCGVRCCKNGSCGSCSCCKRDSSANKYDSVSRATSNTRLNVEISSPSLVSTTYVEMQPKPPPTSPTASLYNRGEPPAPPVSFDEEQHWQEVWDPNYKRNYWWNKKTKEARWVKPY